MQWPRLAMVEKWSCLSQSPPCHISPDMILTDSENKMYIVELTVGHESSVDRNIK